MHCVSAYPFNDENADLGLISYLKESLNVMWGIAVMKGGYAISFAATALGISSLERHFTLDRTMYGSDQAASITPKALKDLVAGVRTIEKAVAHKENKTMLEIEKPVAEKLRKHLK